MNCANHPDQPGVAFCRQCGKPLCAGCARPVMGTVYCEEHLPAVAGSPWEAGPAMGASGPPPPPPGARPYSAPDPYGPGAGVSPGLAFLLGWIPGVGAIYNAQYAKGLVHALIFGMLVSILSSDAAGGMEPLVAILLTMFFFYMAFEAYHTALHRQRGLVVDEFSSIFPARRRAVKGFPVGPLVMIGLGIVFLLNTLEVIRFRDMVRLWPMFLIGFGLYLMFMRLTDKSPEPVAQAEDYREGVPHER